MYVHVKLACSLMSMRLGTKWTCFKKTGWGRLRWGSCCSSTCLNSLNKIITWGWHATLEYHQVEQVKHAHTCPHTGCTSVLDSGPGIGNLSQLVSHMATPLIRAERLWHKLAVEIDDEKKGGKVATFRWAGSPPIISAVRQSGQRNTWLACRCWKQHWCIWFKPARKRLIALSLWVMLLSIHSQLVTDSMNMFMCIQGPYCRLACEANQLQRLNFDTDVWFGMQGLECLSQL